MYTRHACAYLIGLLPIFNASAQHPWPTAPDEKVRHLTSADQSTSFLGLEGYIRLPEDQRTSDVKAALIEALANENERARQWLLGGALFAHQTHGSAEYAMHMARQVRQLNDPATVEVLLPWLCCGNRWRELMINFGRATVKPVMAFATTPQSGITADALAGALKTFRMMVDYWGLSSFSKSEIEQLKQVAAKYIQGIELEPSHESARTMKAAIELAASLHDAELLQMAQEFVGNEEKLTRRDLAYGQSWLQDILADALAGTLDTYQYVPPEHRERQR